MGGRATEEGFTIVELMIVVLILTILTAIAVPVMVGMRARAARSACYADERVVEGAWARYRGSSEATVIADWAGLMAAVVPSELATEPHCPSDGVYTLDEPVVRCSVHGDFHSQ